jgi:uncharacterized BrkB/YihY/UPF0761 family membrane protein
MVSLEPGVDIATPHQGRVARVRARAERAASRYQDRAQKDPVFNLPLVFIARYTARQGVLLASACAFRLFLWMLPLALLIAGIGAGVAGHDSASVLTASKTAGITGAASQEVTTALREGNRSWWVAVVVGGVLFLWTTRTLMRNLAVVNAHAWGTPLPKPRQADVLRTTLIFIGIWLIIFVVSGLLAELDRLFPGGLLVAILLQGAMVSAAWLMISLRLPDRRSGWLDLVPGCLLIGFGLAVLHAVSRVYIPRKLKHSSELYGALGIAGVILGWLLIIGQVIVSAALVNSVWTDYRADRHARKIGAVGD